MLDIALAPETVAGLRVLLQKEDDPAARFRIREFKSGCG